VPRCLGLVATCSGGKATCASWDFESGTTEGITVDALYSAWDGTTFLSTLQTHVTGKRSLAIGVDTTVNGQLNIHIPLCDTSDGWIDTNPLLGVHMWVRIDPAQGASDWPEGQVGAYYSFYYGPDNHDANYHYPVPGAWLSVDDTFQGNIYPAKLTDVVLHVILAGSNWKGTVYVDDIRIY